MTWKRKKFRDGHGNVGQYHAIDLRFTIVDGEIQRMNLTPHKREDLKKIMNGDLDVNSITEDFERDTSLEFVSEKIVDIDEMIENLKLLRDELN